MVKVRQRLVESSLEDPAWKLGINLDKAWQGQLFKPGSRVAVAVGSRRIEGLAELVGLLVHRLQSAGCHPFIVPAMGSHGGATPEGQIELLARMGVSEGSCGAPVLSSPATVSIGVTHGGAEVFVGKEALDSDAIVVINRVAPHTGYDGPVQSGIQKMLAVGLGKWDGAASLHRHGFGSPHLIGQAAELVIEKAPVALGVALVEDGLRRLSRVEVLGREDVRQREPGLLEEATSMLPRLPVPWADLLVVDEIGKDISGTGMDTNIIGRGKLFARGNPPFSAERIVALSLTLASGGNATGVGLADVITRRLQGAMDIETTYKNVLTSGALERARIPVVAENDRVAIALAIESIGVEHRTARVVRIKNTRELAELQVSESLAEELAWRDNIMLLGRGEEMRFDGEGSSI